MRIHDRRRFVLYTALALVWSGVLFFFSAQSAAESGALSGRFLRMFFGWALDLGVNYDLLHMVVRKCAHFTIFLVEGLLICGAACSALPRRRGVALTVALCLVIAVLNELQQCFSEGRACSVRDVAIDFAGALIGVILAQVITRAAARRRERRHPRGGRRQAARTYK